jgi:prolyl oligopeptidase
LITRESCFISLSAGGIAHASKMVATLEAQGHPVYCFENTEGGHASGAIKKQKARVTALGYAYLWMMLR